jgi:hypothetical protein
LNIYKPLGSTFNLLKKHVSLKELVSWLKRGQNVPFLREKCPFEKLTPKVGANIGAIIGILLSIEEHTNTSLCMQDWRVHADDSND